MNPKTKAARDSARFFGGSALNGTSKQKEWAEKIRAEKLGQMTPDDALIVAADSLAAQSKLWIENRDKPASDFVAFAVARAKLIADCSAAKDALDAPAAKAAAEAHNALTDVWGYK